MNNIFGQIAVRIIREQELVIGPLAIYEAKKVQGLNIVDLEKSDISFNGDQKEVVNNLVSQYERLFGPASREVCKDASASLIADLPQAEIPSNLR